MFKSFCFFLFLPILILSCESKPTVNDREKDGLKGNVVFLAEKKIGADNTDYSFKEYNDEGNIIRVYSFMIDNGKSSPKDFKHYIYNYDNNRLESVELKINNVNVPRRHKFYRYDTNGLLIQTDEGPYSSKYYYTEGKIDSVVLLATEKGKLVFKEVSFYNKKNQLLKGVDFDENNIQIGSTEYKYDLNNNIIKHVVSNSNPKFQNIYTLNQDYLYDDNGNWIQRTEKDNYFGQITVTSYQRDIFYKEQNYKDYLSSNCLKFQNQSYSSDTYRKKTK